MVHNESSGSEGMFEDIADIIPGKGNMRIKARVLRLWKVPAFLNPSEWSSIEMVLVDNKTSVLALEESALDTDQVENLIKFCPTKEEMEIIKSYNGEKEKLGRCEQFFMELMKVPWVESKLRVFSFKIQFHSQVSDLKNCLNAVNSVAEEIRNFVKLKRIMQTMLTRGNALNQGTARVDLSFKELSEVPNLYHSSCESKEVSYEDICPALSPQFADGEVSLTNAGFSQYENGSPSPKKSYFKHQRKSTKNSLSTYVETLVYFRRKSCVKRKLNFDDGGDDAVSKTKPSNSSDCKNE